MKQKRTVDQVSSWLRNLTCKLKSPNLSFPISPRAVRALFREKAPLTHKSLSSTLEGRMSEGEREGGRPPSPHRSPHCGTTPVTFPQNSRKGQPRIWYEKKFCVARRPPEKVRPRCGQRCRRGAAFKSPVAEFGNDAAAEDDDAFFLSARAAAAQSQRGEGRRTR